MNSELENQEYIGFIYKGVSLSSPKGGGEFGFPLARANRRQIHFNSRYFSVKNFLSPEMDDEKIF